jgi:uncharacterized protein (TIGR02266 family)
MGERSIREIALADPNTRTGKRTPVTLKIKFKSETLEQFIERYAVDVSQGGIFIRTKEPLAVGTQMRFEFQLRDASPLIAGEGTVVWTRENDPSRPAIAPGMGVRFDRLAEGSQSVLERILAEKAKQAPRPATDSIRPPLFTDTPTRVAPAPIQEQLLGAEKPHRKADDDQHTPLPKPMPFHSDADEFPDEAFEEATKVRALDDLVAATADAGAAPGTEQPQAPTPAAAGGLAAMAGGARPQVGEEPAPGLPSPPEPELLGGKAGATPSPRAESPTAPPPVESPVAKTKLGIGVEGPRMNSPSAIPIGGPGAGPSAGAGTPPARAVPAESTVPTRAGAPARGGSGASTAILIVVLLAVAAVGVWFFVLRDKGGGSTPSSGTGSSGSALATGTGSGSAMAAGTGGSGSALTGGSGSSQIATGSGSAKVETPKAPLAETVIEASVPKAKVEVVGTDQSGAAPFTAKLEKDKPYKVRLSAPGYTTLEVDLVGGAAKQTAALVPKPRVISFKTDPTNALVSIDGVVSSKLTPVEIELTKGQAAKKSVRIRIVKTGFKPFDKSIETDKFTEEDARMIATVDEKLQAQAARPPGGTGTGAGSQAGSGATGEGSGGGTATPPPPPPPPPGDGSAGGSAP